MDGKKLSFRFVLASLLAVFATAQTNALTSCYSGPFIVFFDTGSVALSKKTKDILLRVVELQGICGASKLQIAGHTDTKGEPRLNLKLSLRRAQAVLGYLKQQGADVTENVVTGFGETELLIPTSDDNSEAQNRRVEISFGFTSAEQRLIEKRGK